MIWINGWSNLSLYTYFFEEKTSPSLGFELVRLFLDSVAMTVTMCSRKVILELLFVLRYAAASTFETTNHQRLVHNNELREA
jgi:hypothetical protein